MRILLTGFPTMGGSGLVTTKLGLQLAKKGYDIHFLFYKKPFFLKQSDINNNITFHKVDQPSYALFSDIGSPFTIQSSSKMVDIINDHDIDIVHTHYAIPHAVSSYLATKITDVKTVNTTHGSDTHTLGKNPSYQSTIKLALKESSAVTSVSKYLATETEKTFELEKDSVSVIYNFIDLDEFSPSSKEKSYSIIQASNFRPIKQIPFMIEVFSKLCDDFPQWELKLVGYGPQYPVCIRKARELGIRDRVRFMGVRKDIPSLISNSSILASTSKIESFGLTIAEGMASGTPVWAPRTGGIPEICIDGENGLLYEPNNLDDAVEKLKKLMVESEFRRDLGKNARKRIEKHFSPNKIVSNYEKLYESILD